MRAPVGGREGCPQTRSARRVIEMFNASSPGDQCPSKIQGPPRRDPRFIWSSFQVALEGCLVREHLDDKHGVTTRFGASSLQMKPCVAPPTELERGLRCSQ